MNREDLERLKEVIDNQIAELERKEWEDYRKQPHNSFSVGDWVTDGSHIGVVGWTENKCLNISEEDGFFGLDVKNGRGGFIASCKRNDFNHLSQDVWDYYNNEKVLTVSVTGEQIEDFYRSVYRNLNPSGLKNKLLDAFDSLREFNEE